MEYRRLTIKAAEWLDNYDKITIWELPNIRLLNAFCNYASSCIPEKRVLVIYKKEIFAEQIQDKENCCLIGLKPKEYDSLLDVYNMYEFSDRITVVSERSQYPSLVNYLSIGLLSEEEFFQALLH